MDTKGARALAARIAAGPPEEELPDAEPSPAPPAPEPESAVETIYVKPERAPRREVRIYVRGRDGTLERQE